MLTSPSQLQCLFFFFFFLSLLLCKCCFLALPSKLRTIMWHMHLCAVASESFVGALAPSSVLCRVAKHYFVEHLHSHGANAPKLAALKAPSPRASFLRSEPMTQNKNHHPESKTQSTDAQASVEEQELQGLLETQSAYSVASMQSAVEL
ncbi:unnamed protein product [Musa banksii]